MPASNVWDPSLNGELREAFTKIVEPVTLRACIEDNSSGRDLMEVLENIAALCPKIRCVRDDYLNEPKPSCVIQGAGLKGRIVYAGLPLGELFTPFVLSILHAGGHAPVDNYGVMEKAKRAAKRMHFTSFSQQNCPYGSEFFENLDLLCVASDKFKHTIVDISCFGDLLAKKGIMGVPTIFLEDTMIAEGLVSLDEILENQLQDIVSAATESDSSMSDILGKAEKTLAATRSALTDEDVKKIAGQSRPQGAAEASARPGGEEPNESPESRRARELAHLEAWYCMPLNAKVRARLNVPVTDFRIQEFSWTQSFREVYRWPNRLRALMHSSGLSQADVDSGALTAFAFNSALRLYLMDCDPKSNPYQNKLLHLVDKFERDCREVLTLRVNNKYNDIIKFMRNTILMDWIDLAGALIQWLLSYERFSDKF